MGDYEMTGPSALEMQRDDLIAALQEKDAELSEARDQLARLQEENRALKERGFIVSARLRDIGRLLEQWGDAHG